jgi:hypothetical protein
MGSTSLSRVMGSENRRTSHMPRRADGHHRLRRALLRETSGCTTPDLIAEASHPNTLPPGNLYRDLRPAATCRPTNGPACTTSAGALSRSSRLLLSESRNHPRIAAGITGGSYPRTKRSSGAPVDPHSALIAYDPAYYAGNPHSDQRAITSRGPIMAPIEVHNRTRAEPVSYCIYCGSTDDLRDEHIVPFGLGGRFELPEASCRLCEAITSRFERRVLRGFMRDARAAGKFPSRRPKERPSTIRLEIGQPDAFQSVDLPVADSPGILQLPLLSRAAFLAARPPLTTVEVVGRETIGFGRSPHEVLADLGATELRVTSQVDVWSFVRMLAKIGYSYAVASAGPYSREEVPVLPLILGSEESGSTWVGSADYRLEAEDNAPQHALGLAAYRAEVDGYTQQILVARVKLFASAGATGY